MAEFQDQPLLGFEERTSLINLNQALEIAAKEDAQYVENKAAARSRRGTIRFLTCGCALLLIAAAVTAFVLIGLSDTHAYSLKLVVTTDFRNGPDPYAPDLYPTLIGDDAHPDDDDDDDGLSELKGVTRIDAGLLAALVSLIAGFAYTAAFASSNTLIDQLEAGTNAFLWPNLLSWHWLAVGVLAMVAGVHNIFLLLALAGYASWILLVNWGDDVGTSGQQRIVRKAKMMDETAGGSYWLRFDWLLYVGVWIGAIFLATTIAIYTGFTFGADRWDVSDVHSTGLIVYVIVGLVAYLVPIILYGVHRFGALNATNHYIAQIVTNGIIALYITLAGIFIFCADGIEPPPCE